MMSQAAGICSVDGICFFLFRTSKQASNAPGACASMRRPCYPPIAHRRPLLRRTYISFAGKWPAGATRRCPSVGCAFPARPSLHAWPDSYVRRCVPTPVRSTHADWSSPDALPVGLHTLARRATRHAHRPARCEESAGVARTRSCRTRLHLQRRGTDRPLALRFFSRIPLLDKRLYCATQIVPALRCGCADTQPGERPEPAIHRFHPTAAFSSVRNRRSGRQRHAADRSCYVDAAG